MTGTDWSRRWLVPVVLAVLWSSARPMQAPAYTLLPLATESAQTLPSGVAEAVFGVTYSKDARFPAFTPPGVIRRQTLVQLPQLGFHIGAGDWAEIQATFETLYLDERAANGQTNWQFGAGDLRMASKFWLRRETAVVPALGLRLETKLPNATRSSRLGTDDTDFGADVLMSKDLGRLSAHANLGILLLGNSGPSIGNSFRAGGQDDLFTYVLGVASAPLGRTSSGAATLKLLAELAGQDGSRFHNDRLTTRVGLQLQRGAGILYLGTSAGLITQSENFGASVGFVYTFQPAQLFSGE